MLIIIVKKANNKFSSALPDLFYCTTPEPESKRRCISISESLLTTGMSQLYSSHRWLFEKGVSFCFGRKGVRKNMELYVAGKYGFCVISNSTVSAATCRILLYVILCHTNMKTSCELFQTIKQTFIPASFWFACPTRLRLILK